MRSAASSVDAYVKQLPDGRRQAIDAVRKVILKNLDRDYQEGMQYGMIGYFVPHRVFPAGYHCDPNQPLCFAGLASQKNHMSVYLMCVYGDPAHAKWFRDAWAKTGKRLDMGKSCIRFKNLDDLALDVIGEAVRRVPAKKYVKQYVSLLGDRAKKPAAKRPARKSKKSAMKRAGIAQRTRT